MVKINKILSILLIIIFLSCIMSTYVQASLWDQIVTTPKRTIDSAPSSGTLDAGKVATETGTVIGELASTLLYAAIFIFVGIAIILGIRYMLAAISGQSDKVAATKKGFMVFVIGAVVTFGAIGIFNIVYSIVASTSFFTG